MMSSEAFTLTRPDEPAIPFTVDLCFVDIETTGSGRDNQVIEVAMLRTDPLGKKIHDHFRAFAKLEPWAECNAYAMATHGIDPDSDEEYLEFAEPLRGVLELCDEFLTGAALVAHNAPFDSRMLRQNNQRMGRSIVAALTADEPKLCTLEMARRAHKAKCPALAHVTGFALSSLRVQLGFPQGDKHRAIKDACDALRLYRLLRDAGYPR